LYPNPGTLELTILTEQNIGLMDVYSLEGRWICTWEISNGMNVFSLSDFDEGMYILKGRTTGINQKFWKR